MSRSHNMGRARDARKKMLQEEVKETRGIAVGKLRMWFIKATGLTARKFWEYLAELEEGEDLRVLEGMVWPPLRWRWLVEKVTKNPKVEVEQLKVWARGEFGPVDDLVDEYLEELEEKGALRVMAGRAWPVEAEEEGEQGGVEPVQSRWPAPGTTAPGEG